MYRGKLIEKIQAKMTRAETIKATKEQARLLYDTMVRGSTKSSWRLNLSANKMASTS